MAFDWKEYVELARFLQRQAGIGISSEALLRSALSRTYYGVFCYARNYARDFLGFRPRYDGEDHGRLRAHLKKAKRWRVGEKLGRLRDLRNNCDYHDQLALGLRDALLTSLVDADYVFASLIPPASSSQS